jgi:hypothetical protein
MKHRKLITILLSLAIMVTFMPTMAFATGQQSATSWTDKVATMTDKDGDTFETVRVFDSASAVITATGVNNTKVVPNTVAPSDGVLFVDFESSMLTYNGTELNGTTWKQASFDTRALSLTVVEPSYAKDYNAKDPKKYTVPLTKGATDSETGITKWTAEVGKWDVTVSESKYESGLEKDQTITYTATVAPKQEVKGTADQPDAFGVPAAASVTVKGEDKTPDTAKVYLDAVNDTNFVTKAGGSLTGLYDGDAHSIATDTVPGYTVSYETYSATTGKWTAATSVSITDVQTDDIVFRVVYTKNDTKAVTRTGSINLNLIPATGAYVGFVPVDAEDGCVYGVAGSEYNAADYIDATAITTYPGAVTDAEKKAAKIVDAANAKAVAKNKTEILAYFNELYTVKATVSKYNPDMIDLDIVEKDLLDSEKAAINKKYATLVANIDYIAEGRDDASVFLNGKDPHDFNVSFTSSVASKTYKGSKTTKKGKLKKDQSITVSAVAENGYTCKYKISGNPNTKKFVIDKNTGKITVKKGLGKGTYKLKVKAYVPMFTDTPLAEITSDTITITVKVKK